jgi:hypothetical protein
LRRGLGRTAILAFCFVLAASSGYLVSAKLGAEALRVEAQKQLTSLMRGEVRIGYARLVIRGGLFIEGERVGVYPADTVPHRPALFIARVSAQLDIFALLAGRFRLETLILDDALLTIRRLDDRSWSPPPLQTLYAGRREAMPDDLERNLDLVNAFEAVTRWLLSSPVLARRVEVRRSRITFVDETRNELGREPLQLSLHQIDARLTHPWLSGEADLVLSALLVAGKEAKTVPIRAQGRKRRGSDLQLSLGANTLPLSIFEYYLDAAGRSVSLRGLLSGQLSFHTRSVQHGTLATDWTIEDLAVALEVANDRFVLERPLLQLDSSVDFHPGRVRVDALRLEAKGVDVRLQGNIDRPLRLSSRTQLDIESGALGLDDLLELVRSLPATDRENLERLLSRVESGRIDHIGGAGVARLAQWQRLFQGELERLPPGVVLKVDVSQIRLEPEGGGLFEDFRGSLELSGDHVTFRDATALWNGEPLPTLNLSIDGVSHLFRGPESDYVMDEPVGALPGLDPLWEIFWGGSDSEGDSAESVAVPFRVKVESLLHPVLRWPLRDARVVIEPTETGLHFSVEEGRWAGVPISGSAVWLAESHDVLSVDLVVSPEAATEAGSGAFTGDQVRSKREVAGGPWATGRIEVDSLQVGGLHLKALGGRFALQDASIYLSQIRANLGRESRLVAHASLSLGDPEKIDVAFKFSLVGGDPAELAPVMGLPDDVVTGRVHLAGTFEGRLLPQTPILAALDGILKMDARDGEIRRELPLVLALAQASQGYNMFSDRDAIVYESTTAKLMFDRGRISTDDFRIEGPIRVYATGWLDAVDSKHALEGTVGIFLFRGAGQLMESLPAFKAILPGSERGLIGAYYEVSGSLDDPVVESMPGKSMAEDLPDVLIAPFQVIQSLLTGGKSDGDPEPDEEEGERDRDPEAAEPSEVVEGVE